MQETEKDHIDAPGAETLRRNRDFRRLWAGQSVSVFGSLVSGTAIPFTAVLLLHATPMQMSLLSVARILPGFLASLLAGVWVDRLPRRPILIVTDLGRAAVLCLIPAAAALGALSMGTLYAAAFGASILTVFFDVAYQSYLPTLVRSEDLTAGNSALSASASVAEVGAFSLSGWLVQAFGGPVAVLIDAASFLASAAFVGSIRKKEPPPAPVMDRVGFRAEVGVGLRAVSESPVLRSLAAVTMLLEFAGPMFGTVFLLYVSRDLGFSPGVLGGIFAVGGVTALLGALAAGPVTRRLGVGPAMVWGLLLSSAGMLLVPLAPGATLLGAALLIGNQVVTDPAVTIYDINYVSLRQSITPDRLLGRVNAAMRFAGWGAMLAGTLAAGVLGERLGVRPTLILACLLSLLAGVCLALTPAAKLRRAG